MTYLRMIPTCTLVLLASLSLSAQHERREEGPRPERPREGQRPHESRGEAGRGREPALAGRGAPQMERREDRPRRDLESARPGRVGPEGREGFNPPRERLERREAPDLRRPPASREAARTWQTQGAWRRDAWPAHRTWQEHRAHRWEREHRTWTQRGGYGGYRIPEPQFVARFGVRHPFLLGSRPVIYRGYPRFWCGGYWFLIVDPWPEFWVDDWYLTDEVYIDYDGDGYYLFNRRHPGIRVALTIFL